jgi:hypothetical protein
MVDQVVIEREKFIVLIALQFLDVQLRRIIEQHLSHLVNAEVVVLANGHFMLGFIFSLFASLRQRLLRRPTNNPASSAGRNQGGSVSQSCTLGISLALLRDPHKNRKKSENN